MNIHPSLILRTPKFSVNATLAPNWIQLKEAIKISSSSFYETIKDINAADLDSLPQKIQFTIWKYFNRAKFRPTPYGTFAGFSFLDKNSDKSDGKILVRKELVLHEFIDWPVKNTIRQNEEELFDRNNKLFTNSSFYLTPQSIRYIACTNGQFELAEIDQNEVVLQILNACLKPKKFNDLAGDIEHDGLGVEEIFSLVNDMIALQLLFSDRHPNIIGEDYFERIDLQSEPETPKYILAERKVIAGNLDTSILVALPKLIELLQQLTSKNEKTAFKNFINRFIAKFDQREVMLNVALDPELGVGYDDLEHGEASDDFVNYFANLAAIEAKPSPLDFVRKAIKSKLLAGEFEVGKTLFLEKISQPSDIAVTQLPNTINLMMCVVDDFVCIEQLGGSTANSLSGRFTIANDAIYNFTKQIAEVEANANPNVLFFDVGYMVESEVDNINRRKQIYDYQVAILNFDTSNDPLSMSDMMLSVRNGEVILRSKKYKKRLIPKLSSAYNYSRSDLSVFRLFCDLQHQGVQSNLLLKLEHLFPDLNYYPRFQYKNLILSMARWKIVQEALFEAIGKNNDLDLCRLYLKNRGIVEYFKTGNGDQTLCFNLNDDLDLKYFIQYMQKQKSCFLEEVKLPTSPLIADLDGNAYNGQFVLALTHDKQIYNGIYDGEDLASTPIKRFFAPGEEWVYFEVFCHQQRSDSLLATSINSYLVEYGNLIKSWFFIRYNEQGDHIRLRILLHNPEDGQKLIGALSNLLKDELIVGIVSDVVVKTYRREIERYGNDLMEDVEQHFAIDSAYVLSLIQTATSINDKYKLCAKLAIKLKDEPSLFENEEFNKIILANSNAFNTEHKLDASTFKKLNATYQVYKTEDNPVLDEEEQLMFDNFYASLVAVLKKCKEAKRAKLFGDLMHMHVNRLFNKAQRTHEMVMYYYLLKDLQRIKALSKNLTQK
ncbi:hypothetical protein EZJ43_16355 [Pedobacter changchengzhani]|uniref:Lantibiotic dehydratase n=1 Tax=Pedobacter changchengzhani TaxID=2529274 RepID=A0A4R5MIE0_9SPHI|nr:lantibiotic dehydratase [Pedobacter changchengzhani]TDG34865.1 hypothetical protein EZJ43_16355 [Pedobacter changchengzhani]